MNVLAIAIRTPSASSTEISEPRFNTQLTPAQKLELENKKAQALSSFAKALNLLESEYVDPETINPDILVEKAITAMLSDLDPHTSYLTPTQFKNFISSSPKPLPKKAEMQSFDLSHNVVYLKLPVFHALAYDETLARLTDFQKKHDEKIEGLVFDLRNNPGGLFDQAVKITNLFIDSGILVSTVGRDKNKPQNVEYALKTQTFDNFPIIVLVNSGTASASEVLAGALQDRDRAFIMGTSTYGKGSVQKLVALPNGGALKFTIARYYTPSGRSIQAEGIVPDMLFIPSGESKLKKHLDNKALNVGIAKRDVYQDIDEWDFSLQNDELVKNAYFYLRK